ncbi:MAG: ferrous iron transport protein B [Chitinophagales bacterium]|nr:ferrous iron transport protein B [Chitinophagales bacterium]
MSEALQKIALLGNPNAGKSSLFNQLTGLRQKVGNFPGVTVERKSGFIKLDDKREVEIIDLPGTYSLYPTSLDERIAVNALIDVNNKDYPDAIIYILDVTHLERHLLLLTQIVDLGFPVLVALNMNDIAAQQNIQCDEKKLSEALGIEFIKINGRTGEGIDIIKSKLPQLLSDNKTGVRTSSFYELAVDEKNIAAKVGALLPVKNEYHALLLAHHSKKINFLKEDKKQQLLGIVQQNNFNPINNQLDEIMQRYNKFTPIVNTVLSRSFNNARTLTDKIDFVITHKFFGPLIFFALMLFIFQAIFAWSVIPMDWIDQQFANLATYLQTVLPNTILSRLLTEGLIPGISGVMVFVPQITILFLLITLLEEVGYMARAVYMFDNIMQKFGLNGRSIVALISGGACAIPAIMSTRTISNWKERLITIMVTPLISCSARIPVFAVLIGFIIPSFKIGPFNSQGLVFMVLYLIGITAALIASYVFKKILKSEEFSFLMLELPEYRKPHWKNVFYTLYEKVSSFMFGAGKIILMVSLVLWFLASFGPKKAMQEAVNVATIESSLLHADKQTTELLIASKKLEASYAGYAGRLIEPVIKPLGFDWKIGIALITSFAAREVFVGTISTLYSIGKNADNMTIKQKLQQEKNAEGKSVFTMAVALSLVLFYLFAMQCMSTLATVYRETKSWKWPMIQFAYMTGTAYIVSFVVYQIFK